MRKDVEIRDLAWVSTQLKEAIPEIHTGEVHYFVEDGKYWLMDQQMIDTLLPIDLVNFLPYLSERFDCDNFSNHLL